MKFSVEVGSLRDAVSHAKVTTDTTLPIYQGLYLAVSQTDNGGRLEVFSMKPGAKALFTLPAVVVEPGKQVVRADQLLAGLRGQENKELVTFRYSDKLNRLCGSCAGSNFKLAILEGQAQLGNSLSQLPTQSLNGSIYDATLLKGVVKRAAWCAHRDATGAITIDALDFKVTPEGYKVIGTDGYIAVRVEVTTDHESTDRVILKDSLDTVAKFLGTDPNEQLRIMSGDPVEGLVRETFFRSPGFFYGSAVSDVQMPAVEGIFSRAEFAPTREVLITRSTLVARLNRIAGFVEKTSPSVKITLRGTVLTLSTASEDGDCVEPIEIVYSEKSKLKESNDTTSVHISNTYLAKVLSSIESEVIVLGLRNSMSPLTVSDEKNEEINTRYVIMGVRAGFEVVDEDSPEVAQTPVVVDAEPTIYVAEEDEDDEIDFDLGEDVEEDNDGSIDTLPENEEEESDDDGSTGDEIPLGTNQGA